jgi:serine/threonine protein kinase
MIRITDYSQFRQLQMRTSDNLLSMCPDVRWIAPEMAQREGWDPAACDVWGLGLYLYLFLIGKQYIEVSDEIDLWQQLIEVPPTFGRGVDQIGVDLLRKLLAMRPEERPHLRDILSHKFLQPTIPFPIVRIPFDVDPRIAAWLNFFDMSIDDALNEAGAAALTDGALYYHLAASAMEHGVTPPDLTTPTADQDAGIDPKYVAFPDLSRILDHVEPAPERPESRPLSSRSTSAKQRSEKVQELLSITRARLRESGNTLLHLDPFTDPPSPLSLLLNDHTPL